jgi:hypothetical protein
MDGMVVREGSLLEYHIDVYKGLGIKIFHNKMEFIL